MTGWWLYSFTVDMTTQLQFSFQSNNQIPLCYFNHMFLWRSYWNYTYSFLHVLPLSSQETSCFPWMYRTFEMSVADGMSVQDCESTATMILLLTTNVANSGVKLFRYAFSNKTSMPYICLTMTKEVLQKRNLQTRGTPIGITGRCVHVCVFVTYSPPPLKCFVILL